MPFDNDQTPDHLQGVKRLAERVERKAAWFNELTRQAKGGNPNKLVSARDCHAHAFAEIDAAFRRGAK